MESGLTASDVLAMTRDRDDGFFGGGASWLIVLLLFWGFMGNGFGYGRGNAEDFATQRSVLESAAQTQRDVLTSSCGTQKEVLQSRYDTALGLNNLQAQMAQCCCDIKGAIAADGQATRQLITDNTINDLREKLNSANSAIVNANQTQYILGQLGRYVPSSVLAYNGNAYNGYSYPYYTNTGSGTVI